MIQIFASFPKWPGGEIMHYLIPPIAIKPLSRPKTSWASKTSNVPTSIPSSRVRPPTTTSRCPSPPQSSWTWTVSISLGLKPRTSAFFLSFIRTIVRQYNISVLVSTSVKLDMNCKQVSLFFSPDLYYICKNLAENIYFLSVAPSYDCTTKNPIICFSFHQSEDSFEVENSELFFDWLKVFLSYDDKMVRK